MGLNEFAGYLAVSLSALATGYLAAAYCLRPAPFYPGIAFPLFGLLFSVLFVQETRIYVQEEALLLKAENAPRIDKARKPTFGRIMLLTSWKEKALFSCSQAWMVNNLNDGMVWGLLPIFLMGAGLPVDQVGIIASVYPGVWGISQLITGPLSDLWGRKWMIAIGMWVQAIGIGLLVVSRSFWPWICGGVLLGIGTALVYPTLLAAISDVAEPQWRASAVGVYRLWRDGGYAVGALTTGMLADSLGVKIAIAFVGGLTFLSGAVVAVVMYETLPSGGSLSFQIENSFSKHQKNI